jgi:hypothetical protein
MPLSAAIDNLGALVGVSTDINGVTRSATTPDIGAIEFTGIPADMSVVQGRLVNGECLSANDSVYVRVKNTIGATIDFSVTPLTVYWTSVGPVNSNGSFLLNTGTVAAGAIMETGKNGVNLSIPGTYTLSVYIGANTVNGFGGNDTLNNTSNLTVKVPFEVVPQTNIVTSPTATIDISAKSIFFPPGAFYFSELCNYKTSTGQPTAGWPTYLLADDYVEITGVPNSDLGGFVLETWNSTSMVWAHTFPTGTLIGPNGTAIIAIGQVGSSVPVPASYYYHANVTQTFGSSDISGRLLKDGSGNIVDAAGYGNFTFPAASNVTASDWSSPITGGSSTSGLRLIGPDNNTGSNWVVSSATNPQDPNVQNTGTSLPSAVGIVNFEWKHNGLVTSTMPDSTVGPFTANGIYRYIASYVTPCGTLSDTVEIFAMVEPLTGSGDTSICEGDSVQLLVNLPGTGPWTLIVTDGTTPDTIPGITSSPWTTTVAPTATTTYSVTSFMDVNNFYMPGNIASIVTVIPAPVVSLSSFADLCEDATAFALSGGLPAGGTYSGTGVGTGTFDPAVAGAGLHTISYTFVDTTGCSAVATENILVNATPVITLPTIGTLCLNTPAVSLGATPIGGTYTGTGIAAGIFDPVVAGVGTHVYTYAYTDTATTCSNSATDSILVGANPSVSITGAYDTLCLTHWITISAGTGFSSYLWSTGDVTPTIDLIGSILGLGTHVISVTVTNSDGCEGTDSITIVVDECVGINNPSNSISMSIYPNPTSGIFNLSITGLNQNARIEILNILGQEIITENVYINGSYNKAFDLSTLSKGNYLLKVITDSDVRTERLIVR